MKIKTLADFQICISVPLITTDLCRLRLCYKFLCSIFSKGKQPFDFIKCNILQKLAYKVKYISQINGGLLMFFGNLRITFFKISWLDCEQLCKESIQEKGIDIAQCYNFHII